MDVSAASDESSASVASMGVSGSEVAVHDVHPKLDAVQQQQQQQPRQRKVDVGDSSSTVAGSGGSSVLADSSCT